MNERGYTFPEVVITLAVFSIASGMGVGLFGPAIATTRVNSQAQRIVSLVHMARATAIREQRDVELRFDEASGSVRLVRTEAGGEVNLADVTLEYGVKLLQFDGTGDTPDAFGNETVADFGDSARMFFISDGSLVDERGVPLNGTIFLGVPNDAGSARAITITGTTARPRLYRWMSAQWIGQ